MVRAGKLKSGAVKKVNRWSSSSQSNPATSKHRNSAQARKGLKKFQDGSSGATGLTADNLRILDKMTGAVPREEDDLLDELDLKSEISGASFRTFVSGVTDCTNMTFNRVKAHWEKNPEKHKEVVAVLAAITEVIREKGLKDESEAAYFAVLSTTLTQVTEEETLAAVSHLFSLNLRKVAPGVIHKSFSTLVQMFMTLLVKGYNSTALLKSLVSCLGTVLKRGTTFESWSSQDTKELWLPITTILEAKLTFT
ncbi:unnamed protein product [Oikopleura dioica]|uniref:RRP12 N-terminal HEAT domain-containing protein n=1 Tax=Oikopleura dioica TaxID=34765 RepID=E4XCN7_OIKDI|nr:unnamed protein product [Oikopleura dioica]CBY41180.1 unnamed protein product [Oikopleura dioica]